MNGLKRWLASLLFADFAHSGEALLNVSYDPTRELYKAINPAFIADWKSKTGESLEIQNSHGGSGAQARSSTAFSSIRAMDSRSVLICVNGSGNSWRSLPIAAS